MAKDPICGMEVDPKTAKFKAEKGVFEKVVEKVVELGLKFVGQVVSCWRDCAAEKKYGGRGGNSGSVKVVIVPRGTFTVITGGGKQR